MVPNVDLPALRRLQAAIEDGAPLAGLGNAAVRQLADIIANLERAELLESALIELSKRASDPDVTCESRGARIMLDEALADAEFALAGMRRA